MVIIAYLTKKGINCRVGVLLREGDGISGRDHSVVLAMKNDRRLLDVRIIFVEPAVFDQIVAKLPLTSVGIMKDR